MSSGGRPFSFLVSSRVKRMPCVQCECVLIRVQVSPERYSTTVNISYLDLYESSLYSLYSPVRRSRDGTRRVFGCARTPPAEHPNRRFGFLTLEMYTPGVFLGLGRALGGTRVSADS